MLVRVVGPRRRLPAVVGHDPVDLAVAGHDLQLGDQAEAVAVLGGPPAAEAQPPPVPPVRQGRPQHVVPLGHQVGDVEGLVPEAVVVAGPPRGQHLVAHPAAVELRLVHAQGGDVQPRPVDRARQREGPADQRRRLERDLRRGHPCRPVLGPEQPGLDDEGGAPGRCRPFVALRPGRRPPPAGGTPGAQPATARGRTRAPSMAWTSPSTRTSARACRHPSGPVDHPGQAGLGRRRCRGRPGARRRGG